MELIVPRSWQVVRYIVDDPNPDPKDGLPIPRNRGREAMAYLTYVIDNYDNLSASTVFVHGHQRSWHQIEPLSAKIRALNLTALHNEGYISLRCGAQMGCERQPFIDMENPNWDGENHLRDFWEIMLPDEPPPRYLSFKCCGQHAASRGAIRKRSLESWKHIRAPLLYDHDGLYDEWDAEIDSRHGSDWLLGTFYEKFWHVLFGTAPEHCPEPERCRQVHFSNAIVCDRGIDLTVWEWPGAWEDTKCITAYDNIEPDESANLTKFHGDMIESGRALREERVKMEIEMKAAWRKAREETKMKEDEEKKKEGEEKEADEETKDDEKKEDERTRAEDRRKKAEEDKRKESDKKKGFERDLMRHRDLEGKNE